MRPFESAAQDSSAGLPPTPAGCYPISEFAVGQHVPDQRDRRMRPGRSSARTWIVVGRGCSNATLSYQADHLVGIDENGKHRVRQRRCRRSALHVRSKIDRGVRDRAASSVRRRYRIWSRLGNLSGYEIDYIPGNPKQTKQPIGSTCSSGMSRSRYERLSTFTRVIPNRRSPAYRRRRPTTTSSLFRSHRRSSWTRNTNSITTTERNCSTWHALATASRRRCSTASPTGQERRRGHLRVADAHRPVLQLQVVHGSLDRIPGVKARSAARRRLSRQAGGRTVRAASASRGSCRSKTITTS